MNEDKIQQIVAQYLRDNLTIETSESYDFNDKYISISIKLGDEEIASDNISVSND